MLLATMKWAVPTPTRVAPSCQPTSKLLPQGNARRPAPKGGIWCRIPRVLARARRSGPEPRQRPHAVPMRILAACGAHHAEPKPDDGRIFPEPPKSAWEPQKLAVHAVLDAFHRGCEERVKILMTGGSGKTSVALWVAEGLEIEPGVGAQTVLVLVPTINLLAQTLREWRDTTRWTQGQYEMLCVCSDAGVAKDECDAACERNAVDVTTDASEVRAFLDRTEERKGACSSDGLVRVVLCTYKSVERLGEAQRAMLAAAVAAGEEPPSGAHFDLAVFDEAHHTATRAECYLAHALRDEGVRIRRRLFMSATCQTYSDHRDADGDRECYTMDDPEVYGKLSYNLTHREAVDVYKICKGFKLVYLCVDEELLDGKQACDIAVAGPFSSEAEAAAIYAGEAAVEVLAVRKMAQEHGARRVLTFHSCHANVERFCEFATGPLLEDRAERCVLRIYGAPLMKQGQRSERLRQFAEAGGDLKGRPQGAWLASCQAIQEGTNVEGGVEAVMFVDGKASAVGIQQAVMRSTRADGDLEYGLVGVVVKRGSRTLGHVFGALMEMDEELKRDLRAVRQVLPRENGEPAGMDVAVAEALAWFMGKHNLPVGKVEEALLVEAVKSVTDESDWWMGELKRALGATERMGEEVQAVLRAHPTLGTWLARQQRKSREKKLLPSLHEGLQSLLGEGNAKVCWQQNTWQKIDRLVEGDDRSESTEKAGM
ncbi:hypothetical protein CYMTET_17922 [Cymbomonas tetramitiformis]|uniref:Helicase ATP-binding domain-containing protein n=1 Tax=Cymbomonas tetramitiformis TaxID=36881 RepID=A0AAE0GAF6_9CHLO|nr:hypothetical protein CYMTET_17922 [Cymbomonas tetramitiformis]